MSDIEYGWAEAWNTLDGWDYDLFNYPFEELEELDEAEVDGGA